MAWINGQWVDDAMFGGMLGSVPGRTPQAAGDDRDYPYFGGEQGGHTGFTPGTGGGLWPWPVGTDPNTEDKGPGSTWRPGFGTLRDHYGTVTDPGGDPNYGDTGMGDTGPQDTRTQKELNVADHAFNVAQRERTKVRLAEDRAKTKRHYAKLRAKGASKQTIAKAKAKSKARGTKIKAQHPTRKSTIIYD